MNDALRARLLGPMDLRSGERQLPPLESARAESVLAYLLLHRDAPQPRQRLAFPPWPESTEGQAQTNLRKVLHILRRALPDADLLIEIGPRTLRWCADAQVWLDVEQFERALAEGRVEEAIELYAGELLEGRYDEWLTGERERLAGLHLKALERLARQHGHSRRWPEAIRCAEIGPRSGPSAQCRYVRMLLGFNQCSEQPDLGDLGAATLPSECGSISMRSSWRLHPAGTWRCLSGVAGWEPAGPRGLGTSRLRGSRSGPSAAVRGCGEGRPGGPWHGAR